MQGDVGEQHVTITVTGEVHDLGPETAPSPRWPYPTWLIRLVVSFGLFGRVFDFRMLNPLAAARMTSSIDWTTYIVGPNYLRSAPIVSFPIGSLPRYVAPVGTALAHIDSLPILTPVYRLLIGLFPDRPIQLLGWVLLAGWVGTFLSITWFLDKIRGSWSAGVREVAIVGLAAVGTLAPFWSLQYLHPTLMQGWILVIALGGALRRCPTAFGGSVEQTRNRWTGVGVLCAAAAIQPYFLPMVFIVVIAPDVALWRTDRTWWLKKTAVAAGLVVAIDSVLGYLGGGGKLGSTGFGSYSSDLAALIDPDHQSRFVQDLHSLRTGYEGYAWTGLGGIALLIIALVLHRRRSRATAERGETHTYIADLDGVLVKGVPVTPADRLPFRLVVVAVACNAVYAWLPKLRVGTHQVLSLDSLTRHFGSLTAVFRANGRFIDVLVWMLLLAAMVTVMRVQRPIALLAIVAAALVIQVADVRPWSGLLRPEGSVHYTEAVTALRHELATGRNVIEVHPATLLPTCYNKRIVPFDRLSDVLLAAAVLGVPAGTGYLSREDPAASAAICTAQNQRFKAGIFSTHTIYIMSASTAPPFELDCRPLTPGLVICDYANV